MTGDDARRGDQFGRRLPTIERRRYVRSICAAGVAGVLGAGGTGAGAAQTTEPRAPRGLHVASLAADAVTLAWYHDDPVDGGRAAEEYRAFVDGNPAGSTAAPDPSGGADAYTTVTLTVSDLDPATTHEFGVRAVTGDDGRSEASTVTATTLDPAAVGEYDVSTVRTETDSPRNWTTVTTRDDAQREVRIRGGVAPGGTCGLATVRELRYDEAADELLVVVDAAPDGARVCPAVEGELVYEVTATVASAPQTVRVEHAGPEWAARKQVVGPDPAAPHEIRVDHPVVDVGVTPSATIALRDDPPEGSTAYDLVVEVDDPDAVSITDATSEALGSHAEADLSIADDGSSLRWTSPAVSHLTIEETDGVLAEVAVKGVEGGASGLTAHLRRGEDGEWASVAAEEPFRVRPDSRYRSLFAADRARNAITFGWHGYADPDARYVVAVDGEEVARHEADALASLAPDHVGEFPGTTVDGLEPGTAYEVAIEERTPEGETEWTRTATLETLPAAGVAGTEFSTARGYFADEIDEWGDVAVEDDRRRVTVAGGFWFGSQPQTLELREVAFEDGVLSLSVRPFGDGADEAIQKLRFEGTVDLDRPVDRVVLELPDRGYRRIWDAALGGDYDRLQLEPAATILDRGQRTELSMRLDGIPAVEADSQVRVSVGDADVARVADVSLPSWIDDDPRVSDDGATVAFDLDPAEHDATAPVDLGTVVLEGVDAGTTSVGYRFLERTGPRRPDGWIGRLEPTLTVTDRGTPRTETTTPEPTPGPVGENTAAPRDPDADGLFEDVNGNDRQDIADAVDLFQHREDVDAAFFDFNDSDGVEIGDAVALFQENSG